MRDLRGLFFLFLLVIGLLLGDLGRHVPLVWNVPAFFVENSSGMQVALDGDWDGAGVVQNIDGLSLAGVIELAELGVFPALQSRINSYPELRTGERFILRVVGGSVVDFSCGWMTAAQRMTLGIPLHPDRMTFEDWTYLPGVGASLAGAIERDRQKNGDYSTLENLQRVKGIGRKRIRQWHEYF